MFVPILTGFDLLVYTMAGCAMAWCLTKNDTLRRIDAERRIDKAERAAKLLERRLMQEFEDHRMLREMIQERDEEEV